MHTDVLTLLLDLYMSTKYKIILFGYFIFLFSYLFVPVADFSLWNTNNLPPHSPHAEGAMIQICEIFFRNVNLHFEFKNFHISTVHVLHNGAENIQHRNQMCRADANTR